MLILNQIYHSDCFDFISRLNDESIDLVIADPPYNLSKAVWDTFRNEEEFFSFSFRWMDAIIPKIRMTGSLYIFNTPYNSSYFLQHLVDKGLFFQNWITWNKRDGLGAAKRRYSNGQETILFFTKSKDYVFNYNDIRIPYHSTARIKAAETKGILKDGKRWFPNPKGKYCGEVWDDSSARHQRKVNGRTVKQYHITPKPESIIERMILASTIENDTVVDFFSGSGTTAYVAKRLNRNYLCADNNLDYVLFSQRRLGELQSS